MSGRLSGKTAVVTGAAGGLGRAIAGAFTAEGAAVVVTDLDRDRGAAAAADLGATFVQQDVCVEDAWQDLFVRVADKFGPPNVLVNNAGFAPVAQGLTPEDIDLEQTRRIFAVNFEGTLLGCKHGIRAMKAGGGSIINMSSIAALLPVPFITAYGAAKSAVRHLTTSVALYCARQGYGIRCNSIHPGQVQTAMHDDLVQKTADNEGISVAEAEAMFRSLIPLGEYGRPEDVAQAAVFLASDESSHVTGDRILVDGGMLLSN